MHAPHGKDQGRHCFFGAGRGHSGLWDTASAVTVQFCTLRCGGILGKLRSVQGGRDRGLWHST